MITASDMLKLSKDCAEYKVNTVYEDSNFKEHEDCVVYLYDYEKLYFQVNID